MKKVTSFSNFGNGDSILPPEVFRHKQKVAQTPELGATSYNNDYRSKEREGKINSINENETRCFEPTMKRCRSVKRCTSNSSASEFSDENYISSTSDYISEARSILDSLSDDEDLEDSSGMSSSSCSRDIPKRPCHRRMDSITSISSDTSSYTTSSSFSSIYMANPVFSCNSMMGYNNVNLDGETNTSITSCNVEGSGIICRREIQALDWSDSISSSGEIILQGLGK